MITGFLEKLLFACRDVCIRMLKQDNSENMRRLLFCGNMAEKQNKKTTLHLLHTVIPEIFIVKIFL